MNEIKSEIHRTTKIFNNVTIIQSTLGKYCSIGDNSIIKESKLYGYNIINRYNEIFKSRVGIFTYTGKNTSITCARIGKYCSISWNVSIGGWDHILDNISTYPLYRFHMASQSSERLKSLRYKINSLPECNIGNDVLISSNVVVLRSVNIGNGAIIGAGSVVNKDVEPYTIVGGVPAKVIRKRFSDERIEFLEKLKWWDWPVSTVISNSSLIFNELIDKNTEKRLLQISKKVKVK